MTARRTPQVKEKEPTVLDLRMDRPGHWGLPVRYQAPPRFLVVSLVVGFIGLAAAGPSLFSVEALTGLLRQVTAIARAVHLAEQLREPPPTQNDTRSRDVHSSEAHSPESWVAQSDGSYKLREPDPGPAQTTHTASGITYHDRAAPAAPAGYYDPCSAIKDAPWLAPEVRVFCRGGQGPQPVAPAPEPTRAADPEHAARVRQNMVVSDYLAAEGRGLQAVTESRQYLARDPALRTQPEIERLQGLLAETGREWQAAAERLVHTPDIAEIAVVDSARQFLTVMQKCVPGRAEFLQRPLVPPGRGPGFAN